MENSNKNLTGNSDDLIENQADEQGKLPSSSPTQNDDSLKVLTDELEKYKRITSELEVTHTKLKNDFNATKGRLEKIQEIAIQNGFTEKDLTKVSDFFSGVFQEKKNATLELFKRDKVSSLEFPEPIKNKLIQNVRGTSEQEIEANLSGMVDLLKQTMEVTSAQEKNQFFRGTTDNLQKGTGKTAFDMISEDLAKG